MSREIVLRSESGKWKHKTKVDDPLFAPILGAMIDAELELPEELTIPGSLGEELEHNWKLITLLTEWMDWETSWHAHVPEDYKKVVEMRVPYHQPAPAPQIPLFGGLQNLQAFIQQAGFAVIGMNGAIPQVVLAQPAPVVAPVPSHTSISNALPPSRVLFRHELLILSSALSLPTGWEAHVAIDERSPPSHHTVHMRASLEHLRTAYFTAYRNAWQIDEDVQELYDRTDDPEQREVLLTGEVKRRGSLLAPFIRNLWLRVQAGTITLPTILSSDNKPMGNITMRHLLAYLDWNAVLDVIRPYEKDERIVGLVGIAEAMIGRVLSKKSPYGIYLGKTLSQGIGVTSDIIHPTLEVSLLEQMYTRILLCIPDDVLPTVLGLEPIIGIKKVKSWERPPKDTFVDDSPTHIWAIGRIETITTSVSDIVGAINAMVFTYLRWYKLTIQHNSPDCVLLYALNSETLVPRHHFAKIVPFLGKTLGLYAMRRILLCLLYYVENMSKKKEKKQKGVVTQKTQENRERNKQYLERAEEFATLLEEYLSKHDGEDEKLVTLALGETEMVMNLRNYYK